MKTNQFRAMMLAMMLVITTLGTVWAQPLIVKGTVTDGSDGSPLVGCSVTVKGTSRGLLQTCKGGIVLRQKREKRLFLVILVLKKQKGSCVRKRSM